MRGPEDPRAEAVTTNLARAADHLGAGAEQINTLFAAARDVTSIIFPSPD